MRSFVVVFVQNDVAPHIAARETHERLWKFLTDTLKRLLQQNLPKADIEALKCILMQRCY